MPEGDTVYATARRIRPALEGKVLTATDFRVPRYAAADLSGRAVVSIATRGKHLLFRVEDGRTIHSHLGMHGAWRLYTGGSRWTGPAFEARAVLAVPAAEAVGFRLSVLEVLRTQDEDRIVGHLGPDPLAQDWDAGEAVHRIEADPRRSIGEALLDQSAVAGFGNIYRSEICFLAGVHPQRPVSDADVAAIVDLGARLIQANRLTGGQITTGDGRPGRRHWVYGRTGAPCRRCGTPIRRDHVGSPAQKRIVYWCPRCQPDTVCSH